MDEATQFALRTACEAALHACRTQAGTAALTPTAAAESVAHAYLAARRLLLSPDAESGSPAP